MRYIDLVKAVRVRVRNSLSQSVLDTTLRACFIVIARTLEQGEKVYIPEFGRFEIAHASSRVIVSNLDGQTRHQVPERRRVRFIPSAAWTERLNEEGDD
jgi:nucleoid DNA-binding protein